MTVKYHTFELYVPTLIEGKAVLPGTWIALRTAILDRFDSFTYIGPITKAWRNDADEIIRDQAYIYRIITDKPLAMAITYMLFLANQVKHDWCQECILWTRQEITAEFYT